MPDKTVVIKTLESVDNSEIIYPRTSIYALYDENGDPVDVAMLGADGKVPASQSQVQSVNGQTGAVNLTAASIGAQAALTGTEGQIVGFDASSSPVAQAASDLGIATLDENGKITAGQATAKVTTHGDVSYSIQPTSNSVGCFTVFTNQNAITVTLPSMTEGDEIEFYRAGAGEVAFVAGSGVTIESNATNYGIKDRYTTVVAKWRTESIVVLGGNVG